jgi:hypothetical protein
VRRTTCAPDASGNEHGHGRNRAPTAIDRLTRPCARAALRDYGAFDDCRDDFEGASIVSSLVGA